jgi:hypothetical protein
MCVHSICSLYNTIFVYTFAIHVCLHSLLFYSLCVCIHYCLHVYLRYCSLSYQSTSLWPLQRLLNDSEPLLDDISKNLGTYFVLGCRIKSLTVRITEFMPLKMRRHVFGWRSKDSFDLFKFIVHHE